MFSKSSIPDAIKTDGTVVKYVVGAGYTLTAGTWYIDASVPDASAVSIHVSWDTNLVATSIKYQSSNMPAFKNLSHPYTGSDGGIDVGNNVLAAAGNWIPKTLASAPDVVGGTSSTAGFVVAGGTAGGGLIDLATNGARRGRTEWVVTTGGVVRQYLHGKQA